MSKEFTPKDDCYCKQLEANYNDAIKLSEEELDTKLNEYPEAKRMCAALILLVEQLVSKGMGNVNARYWDFDVWPAIEESIIAKRHERG